MRPFLRWRLVLLGVVGASVGCSLVDLCYLNPATCAATAADSGSDAPACGSCECLPPPKEFSGCGKVEALLAQGSYAYWVGAGDGSTAGAQVCRAAATDDSHTVTPLYTGLTRWTDYYGGFALGTESIYLGYLPSPTVPSSAVFRGPLDGDAMAPLIPSLSSPTFALSATPNGLFWLDTNHDVCASALDGGIAVGDSGCGGAPLAWGPDSGLADSGPPPLSPSTHNRDYLAVTRYDAYQTFYYSGETISIPLDGGLPSQLAAGPTNMVRPIVANDTDVVWSEQSGSTYALRHVAASGGATALLATAVTNAFAMDSTGVYFAVGLLNSYQIQRVPLAGGAAELVACVPSTAPAAPDLLAVDDQSLYFATTGDSRVYAVPK